MSRKIKWQRWTNPYKKNKQETEFEEDELSQPNKVRFSIFGFLVDESASLDKIFKFWVGHTNFNISGKVCDTITKVDGVESFEVQTRYRFRISVGQMFKDEVVKRAIEEALHVNNTIPKFEESIKKQIDIALETAKKHKYWCVYISPNGKINCRYAKELDKIQQDYNLYLETEAKVGGLLMSYDSEDEAG